MPGNGVSNTVATILLIDDSKTIQKAVKLALAKNKQHLTLETAPDAAQALTKAKQLSLAMIIIDHSLPQKNGYDLANEFKKDDTFKNVPIMLLVGPHMVLDAPKAMATGIKGAIQKPFTTEHFLDAIQSALGNIKEPIQTAKVVKKAAGTPNTETTTAPLSPASQTVLPMPLNVPATTSSSSFIPLPTNQISREEIEKIIKQVVEEITWEVVPGLAESIIREELNRLLK